MIDSFIKSKREEVKQIEETRKDLISDWKKISQTELESNLERFSVIEGKKKTLNKLSQMVKETKSSFSMASMASDLLRIEQFGVYDLVSNHPMKDSVQFRVLTQPSKQDLKAIKYLKTKLNPVIDFRGRNPSIGLPKFSRMAIRDNQDIILNISEKNDTKKVCLSTNCKSIIQSFTGVFEDLWQDSINIEEAITEIETGKPSATMELIKDPKTAKKIYYDKLDSAKKEVLMVTSSNGLIGLAKNSNLLEKLCDNGVSIKIMAPITCENLKYTQELLECCEVRHIPVGYRETTIIDNQTLFHFNTPCENSVEDCEVLNLENVFFTNNPNYVEQTKKTLLNIWIKTRIPSNVTLEAITRPTKSTNNQIPTRTIHGIMKKISIFQSLNDQTGKMTEGDVLIKFHNAKQYPILENNQPELCRYFGTAAFALIHPPENFGLPDFIIGAWNQNNKSSFGADNLLHIYLYNDKPKGKAYELVAVVQNNPKAAAFRKTVFAGSPVDQNVLVLEKEKFQVRVQKNTQFVGWTVPIPLIPSKYVLPPSCVLFEGYGNVKSGSMTTNFPSGRKYDVAYNSLEAFVTFFHPSSKYSGPGTEGYIDREIVLTSHP